MKQPKEKKKKRVERERQRDRNGRNGVERRKDAESGRERSQKGQDRDAHPG